MRRLAVILILLVTWAAFGFGVNRFLASRKSTITTSQARTVIPPAETPAFSLPGSVYLSEAGHLYRFNAGRFIDLNLPAAGGSWIQPSGVPGGRILAVARGDASSDIYLLDATTGAVVQQLTHNATTTNRVELNAWSYWPHLAADGSTVVFTYDGPKTGQSFEVDFAVWGGPITGKLQSTRWTTPNGYTGGDTAPFPLPDGAVVYASYSIESGGAEQILSRIALLTRPGATPTYLTAAADDCSQPAINPAGNQMAVICTADTQSSRLEVIPIVNHVAGTPRVLVGNCLCAAPAWSPDGSSLVYYAPADSTGHFQLWWLDGAAAPVPKAAKQVTTNLDFDATSPPAWTAS